jgi:phosphohistidine phosphatase
MEVFLIRHAHAEPQGARGTDAARPLSLEGRELLAHAERGLRRLGVRFDRLYHSPWLRALQTADALMPLCDGQSVVCAELARGPSPALLEQIRGDRAALVGHEPWLSELLAWLVLGGTEHASQFVLKKGSVSRLQGELRPGGMRLLALLSPKVLRAL